MEKKNEKYNFSSAVLETEEGLTVEVGSEYINDPDFDEQMRNIIIDIHSRDVDFESISSDLNEIFKPYDSYVDFNEEGEDSEYTIINLFFDPEKITDETQFNEMILEVIFHLHCYWSGKLTIENF